jgi:ribosomal protein S18 acetylase RimI-like enzyme
MLRPATACDTPAILQLAVDAGLFLPHETAPVRSILDAYHADPPADLASSPRLEVFSLAPAGPPLGVAYLTPDLMTDRKWDLLMIAVAPSHQRSGIGRQLLLSAESHLRSLQARLLLIETSSLPKFTPTHAFYRSLAYTHVATIPHFYTTGEHKLIFSKSLN